MKVLLVTPEPVDAGTVRSAVGEDPAETEVMVVVPSTESSPLRFWVSDVDDAIADAQETRDQVVGELRDEGIEASGDTGEPEMGVAIQDALATFPADRVVVFTRPDDEQEYREDVGLEDLSKRFGVPVTQMSL